MKTTNAADRIASTAAILLCASLAACAHAGREASLHPPPKNPWVRVVSPRDGQGAPSLADEHLEKLVKRYLDCYDKENGGFDRCAKLIDPSSTELAMLASVDGVPASAAMAQKTLLKNLRLIDRARGVREPATDREAAESPQGERSLIYQAENLRLYALAASMWGSRKYVEAARAIDGYIAQLISPEGAFYAGELTAAPAGARRLDRRIVTSDNGATIAALATLHDVTGDERALERAIRAAEFIIDSRKLEGGGFTNGGEPLMHELTDTLSMGQAMLALYVSTADERWLGEAEDASMFIGSTFTDEKGGGFVTRVGIPPSESGTTEGDEKDIDENVKVARFSNLLARYTGREVHRKIAEHALRYLSSPEVTQSTGLVAGILIAEAELRREPMHIIVVGSKSDPRAQELHRAALAHPSTYRVVEWVEPGPAPFRYEYVHYPRPTRPAAIACADGDCTPPVFGPEELHVSLDHVANR